MLTNTIYNKFGLLRHSAQTLFFSLRYSLPPGIVILSLYTLQFANFLQM